MYCDGPELRLGLRAKPWLSFLGGKAVSDYLQREAASFVDMLHAARRIYAETGCSVLCRTALNEYVYCGEAGFMAALPKNPKKSTVSIGDGDVFLSVFLWIYTYSGSLEAAMRCAVSAAEAKSKLPGAELPQKNELFAHSDDVRIREYPL